MIGIYPTSARISCMGTEGECSWIFNLGTAGNRNILCQKHCPTVSSPPLTGQKASCNESQSWPVTCLLLHWFRYAGMCYTGLTNAKRYVHKECNSQVNLFQRQYVLYYNTPSYKISNCNTEIYDSPFGEKKYTGLYFFRQLSNMFYSQNELPIQFIFNM